jgi:hypothetical protein
MTSHHCQLFPRLRHRGCDLSLQLFLCSLSFLTCKQGPKLFQDSVNMFSHLDPMIPNCTLQER